MLVETRSPIRRQKWRFLVLLVLVATGRRSLSGEAIAATLASRIDRHIEARLDAEGVRPAPEADDAVFLRRVYLDLHGMVPTADDTARFLSDTRSDRRVRLIDALLSSPRYGEYLADNWRKYLVSPLADDPRRADGLRSWLADRFNTRSWDRIAIELLTATGKLEENPAVVYLIEGRLPRTVPDLTDLVSRYFLGIRLDCARCHDHPFVEWTQQDYWGMAAFFTQVQTPGRPKQVYRLGVKDDPEITLTSLANAGMGDGFVEHAPTFLGGEELNATKKTTHRAALASWMTAPENPYFARAIVNRTWWRLFGRGIVNPVDDMHAENPPSHPELLDLLATQFVEAGFDLKLLTRAILLTRAYQRTSRPSDTPEKQAALFGRMSVKVLAAGQLYDSLVTVLGPPAREKRRDVRSDARREFIEFFSEEGDSDPTTYGRGVPHLLRLMNSEQFAGRNLTDLATQLAAPGRSPEEIADGLCLRILSRQPTAEERRIFRDYVDQASSVQDAIREIAWTLLMTSEFSLNH